MAHLALLLIQAIQGLRSGKIPIHMAVVASAGAAAVFAFCQPVVCCGPGWQSGILSSQCVAFILRLDRQGQQIAPGKTGQFRISR